jgi:hypothetical protein
MANPDLYNFMKQLQTELASEYKRIQGRVREDPGTAGDEGEENWAALLKNWLPPAYQIVTKGRIVGHDGSASPQIDVLVLHPSYPRHLLHKKHYLAGGVVAAFECKLTLRKAHLSKAFETCAVVKNLVPKRTGTPYKELHQPILYGLLAHSHAWKGKGVNVAFDMLHGIDDLQFHGPKHPCEMMDVISIASLATYSLSKDVFIGPNARHGSGGDMLHDSKVKDGVATGYVCAWEEEDKPYLGTNLGNLVSYLINSLAHEDNSLRSIADYYRMSNLDTGGISIPGLWKSTAIFSPTVLKKLRANGTDDDKWSEWYENY